MPAHEVGLHGAGPDHANRTMVNHRIMGNPHEIGLHGAGTGGLPLVRPAGCVVREVKVLFRHTLSGL